MLSYLGCPILGDHIYTNRLVQIDDKPNLMEPKDRWRSNFNNVKIKQNLIFLVCSKKIFGCDGN